MSNINVEIAANTFTTENGAVVADQRLHRGGLVPFGTSFTGQPVYIGDFSGGRPKCDNEGHLTFENPAVGPPTKANYITYNADGRIKMNPFFDFIKPVPGEDGPSFLFLAEPY